jgi:hypothetical protein
LKKPSKLGNKATPVSASSTSMSKLTSQSQGGLEVNEMGGTHQLSHQVAELDLKVTYLLLSIQQQSVRASELQNSRMVELHHSMVSRGLQDIHNNCYDAIWNYGSVGEAETEEIEIETGDRIKITFTE